MSLYYDAAHILSSNHQRGSLKSLVYAKDSNLKSKPAHVYALISETAKYDTFLKEVIDNAGILAQEPKLTPILSILLVHDHFFSKGGIAAAAAHPLRQSIEKHKARLQSEFTRARLRHRATNVEQLKKKLVAEKGDSIKPSPRWARVNLVTTSLDEVVGDLFHEYTKVASVEEVVDTLSTQKVLHVDQNIPNLIAFRPGEDLTKTEAYTNGSIILQDKASCFPAYLLLGNAAAGQLGDIIDGCAAPGNKTTHAAAITAGLKTNITIYGCERDATRSKTLQMMVQKAGAESIITVLAKQDFLALDPNDERFANVTHLLLDPSCSGSGILGREDVPKLKLPTDLRKSKSQDPAKQGSHTKKRKRTDHRAATETGPETGPNDIDAEIDPTDEAQPLPAVDKSRLDKLSNLQSLIVEHAFRFPAAERITYSTCSVHFEENEGVVARVLGSSVAKSREWRVLCRDEQVDGLKAWSRRGENSCPSEEAGSHTHRLTEDQLEACIRCSPNDTEGTMGFFVCGFIRDSARGETVDAGTEAEAAEDEEWEGFSDRSEL